MNTLEVHHSILVLFIFCPVQGIVTYLLLPFAFHVYCFPYKKKNKKNCSDSNGWVVIQIVSNTDRRHEIPCHKNVIVIRGLCVLFTTSNL